MCDTIRKNICTFEYILLSPLPCNLEVAGNIEGDEAELLFDVVNEEGLIHDVDGAVGNELLEVVSEGLTAEVEALDGVIDGEVLEDGGSVGVGESAVDDEAALGAGEEAGGAAGGLVEMDEGGRVGEAEGAEGEVLERELEDGPDGGGEREEGQG